MSYATQTNATVFGRTPALSDYYICNVAIATTGYFTFFDGAGNVISSIAANYASGGTFATAGAGGLDIAANIDTDIPAGAVGALLTTNGTLYCSVGAPFDPSTDTTCWEIPAGKNIPLGIVPANLGIGASSWGGGGTTGGTESVTELWRYCIVSDVSGAAMYVDLIDSNGETLDANFRIGGLVDTPMTIATALASATPVGLVWNNAFVTLKVVSLTGNVWFNTAAEDLTTVTVGEEPSSLSDAVLPGMVWGQGAGSGPGGGSTTEGFGPLDLGKKEDSAHASGDVGTMSLAVRKDTAAATAADGDYVPLLTDSTGKLWVNPGTSGSVAKSVFEAQGTFTIATCSNALDINHSACSDSVSFTDASSYAPSCIELFAKFVGNHSNAVAIGERVDLYWVDMNEGGTAFVQGGITTTDATVVEPADTIVNVARLRNHYIGSAVFTTAAIDSPAYLSAIVNVTSPDGAIYYVNRSSQPLAASGHFIVYRPLNSVVV